jgi:hypothetical protein
MIGLERSAEAPPIFGVAFLDWFRAMTERNWAARQTAYFAGAEYAEFGNAPWQKHACWLNGISVDEIATLERTWAVRFPPDWYLFLRLIHAADRAPGTSIRGSLLAPPPEEGMRRPFCRMFDFYNWLLDTELLREYLDWPLDGLLFDVEHINLWHEHWGRKYPQLEDRKKRVTELVAGAPKLIPLTGHRFLVADPCYAGNPVLSVWQSDIVPWAVDIREFFFNEFRGFLRPARRPSVPVEAGPWLREIPFWGEFLNPFLRITGL